MLAIHFNDSTIFTRHSDARFLFRQSRIHFSDLDYTRETKILCLCVSCIFFPSFFFFFLKNYNNYGFRVRSLEPYLNASLLRIFLREQERMFVSEIPILDTDI